MDLHKSLDTISIFDFKMLYNPNSSKENIIIDFENYSHKKIKKFIFNNKTEIKTTFEKLQYNFSQITFSKKELQREKEKAKMSYLTGKKEILLNSLLVFSQTREPDALLVLNEFSGITIKEPITVGTIEFIEKHLKGVENKITILTSQVKTKYPELFKEQKEEVVEDESDNVFLDLDNQALQIELGLETGYKIDIKKTSVTRWVNLIKVIGEKQERLEKSFSK